MKITIITLKQYGVLKDFCRVSAAHSEFIKEKINRQAKATYKRFIRRKMSALTQAGKEVRSEQGRLLRKTPAEIKDG